MKNFNKNISKQNIQIISKSPIAIFNANFAYNEQNEQYEAYMLT